MKVRNIRPIPVKGRENLPTYVTHAVWVKDRPKPYVLVSEYSPEGIAVFPAEFNDEGLLLEPVSSKVAEEIEAHIRVNPIAVLSHEEVKEAAFNGTE